MRVLESIISTRDDHDREQKLGDTPVAVIRRVVERCCAIAVGGIEERRAVGEEDLPHVGDVAAAARRVEERRGVGVEVEDLLRHRSRAQRLLQLCGMLMSQRHA